MEEVGLDELLLIAREGTPEGECRGLRSRPGGDSRVWCPAPRLIGERLFNRPICLWCWRGVAGWLPRECTGELLIAGQPI